MSKQTTRRHLLRASIAAVAVGLAGCSGQSEQTPTEQPTAETTGTATETTATETTAANETTTAKASPESPAGIARPIEGPKHGDDLPTDEAPDDGYPPEFDAQPKKRPVDTDAFDTMEVDGVEVPLVPADVAYYWYVRGEARFVDARSQTQYEVAHIFGSVSSPVDDDSESDPVGDWPKGDRVVAYCDCPHHLSSLRAGDLLNRGWENVYAIDEGFSAWRDRKYPLAGSDTDRTPTVRFVSGETDPSSAGETAWAYHLDSDQKEATEINSDGTYELRLPFVDVTGESKVRVETPDYSVTATLDRLANGYVTADGTVVSGAPSDGGSDNGTNTTSGNATAQSTTAWNATSGNASAGNATPANESE